MELLLCDDERKSADSRTPCCPCFESLRGAERKAKKQNQISKRHDIPITKAARSSVIGCPWHSMLRLAKRAQQDGQRFVREGIAHRLKTRRLELWIGTSVTLARMERGVADLRNLYSLFITFKAPPSLVYR